MKKITYYSLSEQGLRENNEDCCHVSTLADGHTLLAIVADGVGGENAGEIASMVLCKVMSEYLAPLSRVRQDDLRMAMIAANNDVIELQRNPRYEHMATVVSACVISPDDDTVCIAHVGDTRIYALDSDRAVLSKLTKDHSLVGRMLDEGLISEQEAMAHPKRNRIDRCIGSRPLDYFNDYIYTAAVRLTGISKILLCTDGLYDTVCSDDIRSTLVEDECIEVAARHLVEQALSCGSHDNVSLVLIDLESI